MISAQNDCASSDLKTRYKKYKKSRDFYIEYILELQKWGKQQKNDRTKLIKRPCPTCKIQEHRIAFKLLSIPSFDAKMWFNLCKRDPE